MAKNFNYTQIQGVKGNLNVGDEFIKAVEKLAERLKTKPEYILAAMSFETGGSFNPSIQNSIGATGLIQFLKTTAEALGTTTDELKDMTAIEQLEYVEKYLKPFKDKLDSLEAVYTAILFGSPKKPDNVLFKAGTPAYKLNPLDWNQDGQITAREATAIVGARLFGGVKSVQQRLLELGIVPLNIQEGFDDGKWGKNTSKVLAEFQKSKKLPETGLINEETGLKLFPETAEKPKALVLKKGDENNEVEKLQDALVKLGYMQSEKIGGGYGKFGPLTEKAVKTFQKHLGLPDSRKAAETEQFIIASIISGIAKNNPNTQIVKAIQDRLIALDYMTQLQVISGYGIFGNQTERAIKKFQKDNLLQESGIVEAVNFKMLFNRVESGTTEEEDYFVAENGENYTVLPNILMTESLQKKVEKVAAIYFEKKKTKLVVTSGYRPSERQAPAIYDKIIIESEADVRKLYNNKLAIDEILAAYRTNKSNRQKAVDAMMETINKQVRRGVYISSHLRSNAVDIRKTADFDALSSAVIKIGGRVVGERDHYHLELY